MMAAAAMDLGARDRLDAFVSNAMQLGRRVAVVTSGGTVVRLEKNVVRFLDNFSTGRRGSCLVEKLVAHRYAVAFLCRRGSLQPWSRSFPSLRAETLFEHLDATKSGDVFVSLQESSELVALRQAIEQRKRALDDGFLHIEHFETVEDYLSLLRVACELIEHVGSSAIVVTAAAVSDFYIPASQLATHKIQSGGGSLQLELRPVPKLLGEIKGSWAPKAFVVSFKLETDVELLEAKCRRALSVYAVDVVVGNLLTTRHNEVHLYFAAGARSTRRVQDADSELLEERLARALVERHTTYIG